MFIWPRASLILLAPAFLVRVVALAPEACLAGETACPADDIDHQEDVAAQSSTLLVQTKFGVREPAHILQGGLVQKVPTNQNASGVREPVHVQGSGRNPTHTLQIDLFQKVPTNQIASKYCDEGFMDEPFKGPSDSQLRLHGAFAVAALVWCLWQCMKEHLKAKPTAQYSVTTPPVLSVPPVPTEGLRGPPCPEIALAKSVTNLFEEQVRTRPDATALINVSGARWLSYQELDEVATALANSISKAGLGGGDIVALRLPQSEALVVAMLGVMKGGAAWMPLDVNSPIERQSALLRSVGARLVIEAAESTGMQGSLPVPAWLLSSQGIVVSTSPPKQVEKRAEQDEAMLKDSAALFFTSGSTGTPKAVVYGRDTMVHGVICFNKLCNLIPADRVLVKSPPIWAVCEYEIFGPLTVGATAVLDVAVQHDVHRMVQTINDYNITVLMSSGPVLQTMVDGYTGGLESLTHVLNVGGALSMKVCEDVRNSLGPAVTIHNMYGCTETPCTVLTLGPDAAITRFEGTLMPAGVPQPETIVHLLDAQLRPVAQGESGEICFGGPCMSRGYLQSPEATAARFVKGPDGMVIYRTGDVGRWVPGDGNPHKTMLQVEGRLDRQLNLKGVRVAPEEVEGIISRLPGVSEVVVIAVGTGDSAKIVACLRGPAKDLEAVVWKHCKEQLPSHMQPSKLAILPVLPKLPNGKFDIRSLERQAADVDDTMLDAVDSLGQMRKMKRRQQQESEALSAARAIACIIILLYHWYWYLGMLDQGRADVVRRDKLDTEGPAWWRYIVRGSMQSKLPISTFVLVSGYTDRVEAEDATSSARTFMFILFILAVMSAFRQGPYKSQMLWYVGFWLKCYVLNKFILTPSSMRLRSYINDTCRFALSAIVVLAMVWLAHANALMQGEFFFCLPEESWLVNDTPLYSNHCVLGKPEPALFAIYTASWFWVPKMIRHIQEKAGSTDGSIATLAAAVLCASIVILGALDEHVHLSFDDTTFMLWTGGRVPPAWYYFGAVQAFLLVLGFVLISDRSWLSRSGLSSLGRYALTAYVSSDILGPLWMSLLHGATACMARRPGSSLLKLIAMVAYPIIYLATEARLIHELVWFVFELLERVLHVCKQKLISLLTMQSNEPAESAWARWKALKAWRCDVKGVACIDGGTGSEVERRVTQSGDESAVVAEGWSCVQWKTHPDVLRDVHLSYLRSGAEIIIANSYATNRHIMKAAGYEHDTVKATRAAVRLALEARSRHAAETPQEASDFEPLVAGSMSCHPPGMAHGASMDMGKWPEPAVEEQGYREQAQILKDAGADIIFVEMVWHWRRHGKLAVQAADSVGLPVAVCLAVFDSGGCSEGMPCLSDGTLVEEVAKDIASGRCANVDCICIHHTKLPLVLPCLKALRKGGWTGPLGCYPDHGTFKMPHWCFDPLASEYLCGLATEWVAETDCSLLGGCCGIGPESIKDLSNWCCKYNAKCRCNKAG